MSIFRKHKVKTCILETFGVKQGANTSFKKFLTEPRGNFFISSSYWGVGQGVIFLFMIFSPIYNSDQMNFTGNDTIARFPTFMRAYLNIPHKSSNRTNFQSRLIIISRKKTERTRRNLSLIYYKNFPRCIQQVVRKGKQRLLRCRAFPPFYQPTYL